MDSLFERSGGTPQPADLGQGNNPDALLTEVSGSEEPQQQNLDRPGAVRRINVNLSEQVITEEVIGGESETSAEPTATPSVEPGVEAGEPETQDVEGSESWASGRSGVSVSYADIDPVDLPRGKKTRVEANLTALETAQRVEAQHRYADETELGQLAGYTGWGGLGEFFDETDSSYDQSRQRLQAAVSDHAYHTLRASILNAHYTPPPLAEAIWEPIAEAAAGREALRVLEPGSGTGIFLRASGLAGAESNHQLVGVEVDETTARISSLLFPEAEIHHAGFEQTRMQEDSFDVSIGNVPFGDWALTDPRHNTAGMSIHNHFINKALAHTAPGGYAAIITSRYTMDAKNPTAREVIAGKADLVGAVRLPEGAQAELSGTAVGTDVLVFRRRDPETAASADTQQWVQTTTRTVTDKNGVPHEVDYNGYFAANPHRVVGAVEYSSNPYGPGYQVSNREGVDVAEQVRAHITDITTTAGHQFDPQRVISPGFEPGIHTVPEPEARYGHVRYNSETQGFEEYASSMSWQTLPKGSHPAKKDHNQTLRLLAIRDTARELVEAQRDGGAAEVRQQLRQRLHGQWESYTEAFGPINKRKEIMKAPTRVKQQEIKRGLTVEWVAENQAQMDAQNLGQETLDGFLAGGEDSPIPVETLQQWETLAAEKQLAGYTQPHLKALRNDPSLGVLLAVEDMDHATGRASPAAIMEEDVITRIEKATSAETAQEAIGISMAERGHVDFERIAELLGTDSEQTEAALEGSVFTSPQTEQLEAAAQYLSGDVRAKLEHAKTAAAAQPQYESNVAALESVVPETIQLEEVTINPGVPWLEHKLYEQFASETFGAAIEITYNPQAQNGKWRVESPAGKVAEDVRYRWGTSDRSVTPWNVLEKTLNSQVFRLTMEDPTDPNRRVANPKGSDAANDKVDQLKEHFRTWIKADEDRAAEVQQRYNRLFNSIVPADYSSLAESLEFPGLAADRTPYGYQRTAVARALNEPAVLLDHVVGAGKTGSMVMTAMEKRRLGHANKPALVVPGHLVGQISGEWKQWYPDAEVMAIPGGLGTTERRELFARAAAGDWDAVVLADTVFEEVSIDPARHRSMMSEDIAEARDGVEQMRATGTSRAAITKAEKSVKAMEKTYEKLADKPDTGLVFEETGIDFLMVDEAHHYKNLSRVSDVPELDESAGSQRARNLNYILRAMREDKTARAKAEGTWSPGYVPSVVLFATGTPVANKVSEMWVMQQYLRPDLLTDRGIDDVNAWGATFTEQDWRVIATPDGRYQRALKVTGFANVPEMLAFNRSFQDSVTRADLEVPLPELIGAERQLKILDSTEEVQDYMSELQERVDAIKRGDVDPSEDNVLKVVHEGRMVALDPRLMGLEPPADGGRPAAIADEITRIHAATADNTYTTATGQRSDVTGGLQIVFADLSTPKPDEPERFAIYEQLKDELIDRGMGAEKIAFIHEAAKDADKVELFRKARDGEINVLIGSTQKMGTGMNVQRRAVALHHVDPPWRPADVEQREGRIIRQGNQNQQVEILAYGAEATTDTFMWSKLSQKAGFIDQLKNPTGVGRTMEDPLGGIAATAANAQSVLSGDPRIGDLLTLESEISTLERLEHSHSAAQARARASITQHQAAAERYQQRLPQLRQLATEVTDTRGDRFAFTTADGRVVTDRGEAAEVIAAQVRRAAFIADQDALQRTDQKPLGQMGGLSLETYRHLSQVHVATAVAGHEVAIGAEVVRNNNKSPEGLLRQVQALVSSTEETVGKWERAAENHATEAAQLSETMGQAWARGEELETRRKEYDQLKADLGYTDDEATVDAAPAELSSEELGELLPEGLRIEHKFDVRDGDVVRIKDGPHGTGYYHARRQEVEGEPAVLVVWPEDGTEGLAEPVGYRPFMDNDVHLVSRQRASLSAMENMRLATKDDPTSVMVQQYAVREGMRVAMVRKDDQQLVTGTVGFEEGESRINLNQVLIPEDGGQPVRFYDDLDKSHGVMQLDYQPPTQRQPTDSGATRVEALAYGVQLTEDVEGLGDAGDLLVSRAQRFGGSRLYVLDPHTGTATHGPGHRIELEPHQYQEPVMITDEDKRVLGAPNTFLVEETEALGVRAGDQVPLRDLDKKAGSGEPVTVLKNFPIGSKTTISYKDLDGRQDSVEIPQKQQVRVQERARCALGVTELAKLRIGVSIDSGGNPVPGAERMPAEALVDSTQIPGRENPDVVISYGERRAHKMIAGRVASAEMLNDQEVNIELVTRDSVEVITADWNTEVAVTAEAVEIEDLDISGTGTKPTVQPAGHLPPQEPSIEQQVAIERDQAARVAQPVGTDLN